MPEMYEIKKLVNTFHGHSLLKKVINEEADHVDPEEFIAKLSVWLRIFDAEVISDG